MEVDSVSEARICICPLAFTCIHAPAYTGTRAHTHTWKKEKSPDLPKNHYLLI